MPDEEELRLIEPSVAWEAAFVEMLQETLDAAPPRRRDWQGKELERARADFITYVGRLLDYARGRHLPSGWVPQSTYWLVRGGRVLGTSSIRHRLTPHLEHEGGHVGYGIRPGERGRGYGTQLCALTLEKARELGMRRILITCDKDNIPSARVIQKNGGLLEDERISKETGKIKQRYWFDLRGPGRNGKHAP